MYPKELPRLKRAPRAPAPAPAQPEYRFLKCLERGPLGETWRVCTTTGAHRLAQLLPPGDHHAAIERLRFIHSHRSLMPLTVVPRDNGQPYLVTDFPSRTLTDRFNECQRQGLHGI